MTGMALVINGERIDDALISREAEAFRQRFHQLTDRQRQEFGLRPGTLRATALQWGRETVIEQVLLRQAAVADPAPLDAAAVERNLAAVVKSQGGEDKLAEAGLDPRRMRADLEVRMRVDRLIDAVTSKVRKPRPKELAEHYRRNMDQFKTDETVRAAHIVKHVEKGVTESEARDAAEALRGRLQAGAAFEDVADRFSDCPGNGGDLGYFARGKMVREFEEVVFNLPVGETSGVFQTVFGFHIAKVLDRRLGGVRPFREVRGEIRRRIVEERRKKSLEAYLDRLLAAAKIEDRA